jgi:hypothetical protein
MNCYGYGPVTGTTTLEEKRKKKISLLFLLIPLITLYTSTNASDIVFLLTLIGTGMTIIISLAYDLTTIELKEATMKIDVDTTVVRQCRS